MPVYDSNLNRVLVTIRRPKESSRVYAHLEDSLTSVFVPEPDEQGRIDIGIHDERNDVAARGIRKVLDRQWPDSAEWIDVEATSRPVRQAR
jgi:hypothetical protein